MTLPGTISLKEHLEALIDANDQRYAQRFDAQEKAVAAALSAADRAVLKAEAAAEKRFEGVNEFRQTLADQQRTLMPRAEVEVLRATSEKDVGELKKRLDTLTAERAGVKGGWGYAVGLIGAIIGLLSLWKLATT